MERELEAYYAARAKEYDRVYQLPDRQADLRALEQWLPQRFAGARVLEIACGTGYWTEHFAPLVAQLVGLDASSETLAVARSKVQSRNVRFIVGDAYDVPRDLGTFDAAFAGFWFSHVPRQRQREFIGGLNRVLEPGSHVVLLDNFFATGKSSAIVETDSHGNTFQARKLENGSAHRVLKNFPEEAELRALLTGIGRDPSYHRFGYYWVFEYRTP
jgi:ubiquinone/menaquinone biosynthesis C-methylase UbiE